MLLKNLDRCLMNIYRLFCLHECLNDCYDHESCVKLINSGNLDKWSSGFCKVQEIAHLSVRLIGVERKDKKTSMVVRRQLLPTLEGIFWHGFKKVKQGWFVNRKQHVWNVVRDLALAVWEQQKHYTEEHLTALKNGNKQTVYNKGDNLLFIYYALRKVEENHSVSTHRTNENTKFRAFLCSLLK
jgi:hypothetical protein